MGAKEELESIRQLFEEADSEPCKSGSGLKLAEDGSGTLEKAEFVEILNDPVVQHTLLRMEIPIEDPGTLFDILDPGNDSLSFPTFAQGLIFSHNNKSWRRRLESQGATNATGCLVY